MKIKLRNSIRLRLFLQVASAFVICAAAIIICNKYFLEKYYMSSVKKSLEGIFNQIGQLENVTDQENLQVIYDMEALKIINIKIFNGDHELLYDTNLSAMNPSSRYNDSRSSGLPRYAGDKPYFTIRSIVESREISRNGGFFEMRRSYDGTASYVVYINELPNGNIVQISHSRELVSESARLANKFIIPIIIAMFSISIAWLFVFSKRFTKPLIDMSNITQRMSELDFSQRCKTGSNDEIGKLASNINNLSDALDNTLSDLQAKNEQLQLDIEFERRLEERRRDFISNISHELKTPIAIIQGYAEGLKIGVSDDPEKLEKYCSIIIDESEKMNSFVLELLELSKYNSVSFKLEESSFTLHDFVERAVEPLMLRIQEKGIEFVSDIPGDAVGCGDVTQLMKVINNYVSNAISHAAGDKLIRITCEERGDMYRLRVFNTGDHIPDADREKIWLSFYRGDKSRNRDSERFGLGLSIVKAVAELHGTECGAENVDGGVEFWYDIKASTD